MRKGFTLIELLIASSIFVIVMMMATGIFSAASSYYVKIKEARNSLTDGQKILDMVSTDIRMANGSAKVKVSSTSVESIGELALLNCNESGDTCDYRIAAAYNSDLKALLNGDDIVVYGLLTNDLIIIQRSQKKIIRYHGVYEDDEINYGVYRYESALPASATATINLTKYKNMSSGALQNGWSKMNTASSAKIIFNGEALAKTDRTKQSYVRFGIKTQSIDWANLPATMRSAMQFITMAESRDYNP